MEEMRGKRRSRLKNKKNKMAQHAISKIRKARIVPSFGLETAIDYLLDRGMFSQPDFRTYFNFTGRQARRAIKGLVRSRLAVAVIKDGRPVYSQQRNTGEICRMWEVNPNLKTVQ